MMMMMMMMMMTMTMTIPHHILTAIHYLSHMFLSITRYQLMNKLHAVFATKHDVEELSLHVRTSNTAAINLYSRSLRYLCAQQVPNYYEDGEAAWVMKIPRLVRIYS
jgi:peptide alpha-N-acetyltransferase